MRAGLVPRSLDVSLPNGTDIDGRYVIEDVIAWGGMGVVYRATHRVLGSEVALKTMRSELTIDEQAYMRFVREARNAAKLKSRHVARVFDFGRMDCGEPYLVMELLKGDDLSGLLSRDGAFTSEEAIDILLQACDALGEAHEAGIIHRDLKPENLFLAELPNGTSELKILDFGLSKNKNVRGRVLTQIGRGMGSPNYMAPEQMRGKADLDHRADIWSLGAVAYELCAGEPAFTGETVPEICAKVLTERPIPLAEANPDVWPELAQIIERCLEPNPDDRFSDIAELTTALERAKRHEPEELDDSDFIELEDEPPLKIAGLRRRWPKAVAVAGVGIAAAAAWSIWSGHSPLPDLPPSVMTAVSSAFR